MTTDLQAHSAAELFAAMKIDFESLKAGKEFDYQARYEASVRAIGAVPILTEAFRRFADSTLTGYLNVLAFAWKNLSYSDWQQIVRGIDDDRHAIYQFVWFAAPSLGLNVLEMTQSDPEVSGTAKAFIQFQFPGGGSRPGRLEREKLEEIGVDPIALWRRLELEGAPMHINPSALT